MANLLATSNINKQFMKDPKLNTTNILANLLATSNINKQFMKDPKLNITNMCKIGWMHAPLFITGNRGGVSSVEKVIITLICLSSVNWQVLKIPTTRSDKLK